jgi:hypothetical protein
MQQVPIHRPPTSRNPISGGSWVGRVSDHRRAQVRARGTEDLAEGPTGPIDAARRKSAPVAGAEGPWTPVFDTLERELMTLGSVLLCTVDGRPVAAQGLREADLPDLSWQTAAAYAAAAILDAVRRDPDQQGVETIQLASGLTQTVVARVPTSGGQDHLLSLTAEGTSPGVLLLRARQAAYELRQVLPPAE